MKINLILVLISFWLFFYSCSKKSVSSYSEVLIAWWGGEYNTKYINRIARIINKQNPDLRLKPITITDGDYNLLLSKYSASGKTPDILLFNRSQISYYLKKDLIEDLTPYLENDPEFKELFLNKLVEGARRGAYYGGRPYAVPIWDNVFSIFYNQDKLNQLGLSINSSKHYTWDDFYQIVKKMQSTQNKEFGFGGFSKHLNQWSLYMLLRQYGHEMFINNGKSISLNSSKAIDAFNFVRLLIKQDIVPDNQTLESYGLKGKGQEDLFKTGKLFSFMTGRWGIDTLKGTTVNYGIMRMPYKTKKYMGASPIYLVLSKDSKNKALAIKVLKHFISVEGQKFIYKVRTDIPVNIDSLNSKDFMNSRGKVEYNKIYKEEILKAEPFLGEELPFINQWSKEYAEPALGRIISRENVDLPIEFKQLEEDYAKVYAEQGDLEHIK